MIYQSLVQGPYKIFPTDVNSTPRSHFEVIAPAHGDGPASKTWDMYKVEYANPVTKPAVTEHNRKSRLATLQGNRFVYQPKEIREQLKEVKKGGEEEGEKGEEGEPTPPDQSPGAPMSIDTLTIDTPKPKKGYGPPMSIDTEDSSDIVPPSNPIYDPREQIDQWVEKVYDEPFNSPTASFHSAQSDIFPLDSISHTAQDTGIRDAYPTPPPDVPRTPEITLDGAARFRSRGPRNTYPAFSPLTPGASEKKPLARKPSTKSGKPRKTYFGKK